MPQFVVQFSSRLDGTGLVPPGRLPPFASIRVDGSCKDHIGKIRDCPVQGAIHRIGIGSLTLI